jgi:hypothetical protein
MTEKNILKQRFNIYQVAAVILAFFAFFMAALVSRTVFDRLPHLEDEVTYIYQARIFARGDVVVETPQPRGAYWQPFVVDYEGNRFGKYTPGWPALLSVGVNLGQTWVINAFCGMLTVALVYRLGRDILNPDVGLIAAALTAFSPMALLQNATLMGHPSALFYFTLFMFAYWHMEKSTRVGKKRPGLLWGILAGVGLGLLVINRPLSAIGVTLPFILWSTLRAFSAAWDWRNGEPNPFRDNHLLFNTVRPLFAITITTIIIGLAIPLYNQATIGDAFAFNKLYTLVWDYDQVGFGECCGQDYDCRNTCGNDCSECGHTIVKGVRHARFDLSLTAADLFGWQVDYAPIEIGRLSLPFYEPGIITDELQNHLRTQSGYWQLTGLSFFILPFGLLVGFRQRRLRVWMLIGLTWLALPLAQNAEFLKGLPQVDGKFDGQQIWYWLMVGALWMLIPPLVLIRSRKHRRTMPSVWTWLFLAVTVSLIGTHLAYWIGSQRYSTRYYYEALTTFAIIGALPIGWLARRTSKVAVYGLFGILLVWTLYGYSMPRITALDGFNSINVEKIKAVENRQFSENTPLLVIATTAPDSRASWRSFGALMAVTSPYLDSDIVVAWDNYPGDGRREEILARFPDRQVIDMQVSGDEAWFPDEDCAIALPGAPETADAGDCAAEGDASLRPSLGDEFP